MIFEFDITEEQKNKINKIKEACQTMDIDCFIRFWSKNEVQIDGSLLVSELKCVTKIMEYLQGE